MSRMTWTLAYKDLFLTVYWTTRTQTDGPKQSIPAVDRFSIDGLITTKAANDVESLIKWMMWATDTW